MVLLHRAPGRRCRRRQCRRESWVFLDLELIQIGKGSPMDRAKLWDQRDCAAVANRAATTGAIWKQRRGLRLPCTSALGRQWRPKRQGDKGHAQHTLGPVVPAWRPVPVREDLFHGIQKSRMYRDSPSKTHSMESRFSIANVEKGKPPRRQSHQFHGIEKSFIFWPFYQPSGFDFGQATIPWNQPNTGTQT